MWQKNYRWKQRLDNFEKAFNEMTEAIELKKSRQLSKLEIQGLIQCFENTHELAWNTIKDFFEYQGTIGIMGSRDATREAFKRGLIKNGDIWMEMIKSRNLTSHTYNKEVADKIVSNIDPGYYDEFAALVVKLKSLD